MCTTFINFSIPFVEHNSSTHIPTINCIPADYIGYAAKNGTVFSNVRIFRRWRTSHPVRLTERVGMCFALCLLHTVLHYTTLHYTTLPLASAVRYGCHEGLCLLREVYFMYWMFRKSALLPSSEFSALLYCLINNTRAACLVLCLWRCLGSRRRYCEY